jgi:hypothetical protein
MWPWVIKRKALQIAGVLLLAIFALAGCVEVKVVDSTPAVTAPDTSVNPQAADAPVHNLAVLTVDFDPPLSYQQLIKRRQSVTLLVVVENTGSETERDVTVRAELTTLEDPELLLTRGASVASIAPGEIQVVRFARLGDIPYHQSYRLEVSVDPVDGEGNTNDNRKAFDIQIHQE